jgi:hypothetical protein
MPLFSVTQLYFFFYLTNELKCEIKFLLLNSVSE